VELAVEFADVAGARPDEPVVLVLF
jgi:hypothetical protein